MSIPTTCHGSKSISLAALICVALAGQALAADLPPSVSSNPAVQDVPQANPLAWQGVHVGVVGGFTKFKSQVERPERSDESRVQGAMLGGLAGFDMQLGNVVLGAEADTSFGDVNGISPGAAVALRQFSTFRGRLGYAFGDVLLYGTGGLALADMTVKTASCPTCLRADKLIQGFTYGGGIETKLTDSITLRGEYLHTDLDTKRFNVIPSSSGRLGTSGMHTFRAAVSYQLPVF